MLVKLKKNKTVAPVINVAATLSRRVGEMMKRKRMNDLVGLMVATDGSCVIP